MSIDSSWTDYLFKRAPRGILCQFMREGQQPWIGVQDDFRPEYNVAGLYWRLTGIGRERLEALPPQVRAQIEPQPFQQMWANLTSPTNCWRDLLGGQG